LAGADGKVVVDPAHLGHSPSTWLTSSAAVAAGLALARPGRALKMSWEF